MTADELTHRLEVQHSYGHECGDGDNDIGRTWDAGARSIIASLRLLHPARIQPFFRGMYAALEIVLEGKPFPNGEGQDDQQMNDWNHPEDDDNPVADRNEH